MTDDRYKQIMADLGQPNSRSLLQALQKVANEVAQEQQATLRAALDEAPGEEREAFEAWYVLKAFDYARDPIGSRDYALQWAAWQARAMLAARPEAPKGEPVAEIVGGILRWHIPDAGWALPQQYLRGVHLLYAARPSAPTVALPEKQRYRCGDCRHADSWGIPQTHGCQLACHYEPLNAGKEGGA